MDFFLPSNACYYTLIFPKWVSPCASVFSKPVKRSYVKIQPLDGVAFISPQESICYSIQDILLALVEQLLLLHFMHFTTELIKT